MDAAQALPFSGWESFYVIAGSSAAALTGLNFVVIALSTETQRRLPSDAIRAYSTPTIVHFCFVLLFSAILSAPWQRVRGPALCLLVSAIVGLAYCGFITWQAAVQTNYKPVFEDWLFHSILPITGYAALLVASVTLQRFFDPASFVIAGVSLLLLYVGIHNAWDTVLWMAQNAINRSGETESGDRVVEGDHPQAPLSQSAPPARTEQKSVVG